MSELKTYYVTARGYWDFETEIEADDVVEANMIAEDAVMSEIPFDVELDSYTVYEA